jgi:hypothetical protein
MASIGPATCAPSPCGPAFPVSRLAGRYPCDYYGHSVAPDRSRAGVDPTFVTAVRIERDLGVPSASFNALTGHRSCAPEDCSGEIRSATGAGTGYKRLSGRGSIAPSGGWASRNQSFAISRGPHGTPFHALGHGYRFPSMLFSLIGPHGLQVSHRVQRFSSNLCPLRGRYSSALRGARSPRTT